MQRRKRYTESYTFAINQGIAPCAIEKNRLDCETPAALREISSHLHHCGISTEKIVANPLLLKKKPDLITSRIFELKKFFREEAYGLYTRLPRILLNLSTTVQESRVFLNELGIDWRKSPLLLTTKASTKKEKLARIFRDVCLYPHGTEERRREGNAILELLRKKPEFLLPGISNLYVFCKELIPQILARGVSPEQAKDVLRSVPRIASSGPVRHILWRDCARDDVDKYLAGELDTWESIVDVPIVADELGKCLYYWVHMAHKEVMPFTDGIPPASHPEFMRWIKVFPAAEKYVTA